MAGFTRLGLAVARAIRLRTVFAGLMVVGGTVGITVASSAMNASTSASTSNVVLNTVDGWQDSTSFPPGSALADVVCPSAEECFAVGSTGLVGFGGLGLIFKSTDGGETWTELTTPDDSGALESISCPTTTECVAVGSTVSIFDEFLGLPANPTILITTDGGLIWNDESPSSSEDFAYTTVSCFSADDCVALGQDTGDAYVTLDGGADWENYTIVPNLSSGSVMVTSTVSGISCNIVSTQVSDCIAVGYTQTTTNSYSGAIDAPFEYTSGAAGTSWEQESASAFPSGIYQITEISCFSATVCSAIGINSLGAPVLLNTTTGGLPAAPSQPGWTETQIDIPGSSAALQIDSIYCPDGTGSDCLLSGTSSGAGVLYSYDTTTSSWQPASVEPAQGQSSSAFDGSQVISGLACPSYNDCIAVGTAFSPLQSVILTTSDASSADPQWSDQGLLGGLDGVNSVTCPTTYVCWAAGSDSILESVDSGNSWTVSGSQPEIEGDTISCSNVSDCEVEGINYLGQPTIYFTTDGGTTWQLVDPTLLSEATNLSDVTCPISQTFDCIAVGQSVDTTTESINGIEISGLQSSPAANVSWEQEVLNAFPLAGISCPTSSNCTAVGNNDGGESEIETSNNANSADGSSWSTAFTDDLGDLSSISCPTTFNCTAVATDASGAMYVSTTDGGSQWSEAVPTALASVSLEGIFCTDASTCNAWGEVDDEEVDYVTTDAGAEWSFQPVPSDGFLESVFCTSDSYCIGVGSGAQDESAGGATFSDNVLSISTTSLPSGVVGTSYSAKLATTSLVGGYNWQISEGALPNGLSLSSSGSISGAPTASGMFTFTVELTDAGSSFSQPLTINVSAAPSSGSSGTQTSASSSGGPVCSANGVGSAQFAGGGYWLAASNGAVYSCGNAPFFGSLISLGITPSHPIVGIAATPDGQGFWLVGSDGGLFAFGDAKFYGSTGGLKLNSPVIGIASTGQGGYYEVALDGGIFSFGPGANFYGSMGGQKLNSPISGMAVTSEGGYYEVGFDGGIFSFGPGATFYGSMGGQKLNSFILGIAVNPGGGYYEVGADGGVFAFDAAFHGSTGCSKLNQPIRAIVVSPDATEVGTGTDCGFNTAQQPGGYQFVAQDGGVFSFGNATFAGSMGGQGVTDIVGIANS